MRPPGRFALFLFGLIVVALCLPAQVPTGKIFGTVTDDQDNPLPGAAIEATSPKLVGSGADFFSSPMRQLSAPRLKFQDRTALADPNPWV